MAWVSAVSSRGGRLPYFPSIEGMLERLDDNLLLFLVFSQVLAVFFVQMKLVLKRTHREKRFPSK